MTTSKLTWSNPPTSINIQSIICYSNQVIPLSNFWEAWKSSTIIKANYFLGGKYCYHNTIMRIFSTVTEVVHCNLKVWHPINNTQWQPGDGSDEVNYEPSTFKADLHFQIWWCVVNVRKCATYVSQHMWNSDILHVHVLFHHVQWFMLHITLTYSNRFGYWVISRHRYCFKSVKGQTGCI